MKVSGTVMAEDAAKALLDRIAAGGSVGAEDVIQFDDVEVDDDLARDELPEITGDDDCDGLADRVDEGDLADLACAIRCGERAEAELLLDRIFDASSSLTAQIQMGRYRLKARKAA